MDIRSIESVPVTDVHQGTTKVWWLLEPRELRAETLGGHLELVAEFEVEGGGAVHPHKHPTYEFYYVISGRGRMVIEDEVREVSQGDLVTIPPNAMHSIEPVSENASIRCLAFAAGIKDAPEIDYVSE